MTNLTTVQTDSVVVSLQRASTALAEARTIQQTKKILDVAAAAEVYARRQHLGEEIADQATAIKVEALRKLGEMLRAAPKAKGEILRGTKKVPRGNDSAPTLAELGLDKKESALAQKLAALPEEAFEQVRDGHTTIAKAIAAVEAGKPKPTVATPKTKPEKEPSAVTTTANALDEAGAPSDDELADAERAQIDDAERVRLILESNDAIATLSAKVAQQAAQIRILESRVRGLINEKDEAVKLAKSWRSKFDKLERAQRAAA